MNALTADLAEPIPTLHRRGYLMNLAAPVPEDFDLVTVSSSLSQKPRYNGMARFFYPVSEHLLSGAYAIKSGWRPQGWDDDRYEVADLIREWLAHEFDEVFLLDVPTPLKIRINGWPELSRRHDIAGRVAFGLEAEISPAMKSFVKQLDTQMLVVEAKYIMSGEAGRIMIAFAKRKQNLGDEDSVFLNEILAPRFRRYEASRLHEASQNLWRDLLGFLRHCAPNRLNEHLVSFFEAHLSSADIDDACGLSLSMHDAFVAADFKLLNHGVDIQRIAQPASLG